MNSTPLRLLGFGICAGLLLSVMRAPLGLDWTQLPATSGSTDALFRASAMIATALFLSAARPAFRGIFSGSWLLFAVLVGFTLHGFVLSTLVSPTGAASFGLVLICGTVALRCFAGNSNQSPTTARGESLGLEKIKALAPGVGFPERFGLFLAGAGVALAFEALAHQVRLLGLGLPEDDTLQAFVFLLLCTLGAVAFGPFLRRKEIERPAFAYGLSILAASALAGLWFLSERDREGLFLYLRRMDLFLEYGRRFDAFVPADLHLEGIPTMDGTSIGTWWVTGLLAAAAWVVPAFLFGATVGGTRHPGRISNALLGAAFGLLLRPWLIGVLAEPRTFPELDGDPWAWRMVVAGTVLAAGGSALAIAVAERGRARRLAPVLALGAIALPWLQPRLRVWNFSPWYVADIEPELTLATGAGLLTLEDTRGGVRIVTLDRRRMTPSYLEFGNDLRRLRYSLALVARSPERRPRVLLVGQMTPEWARFFREANVEVDRTAAWYDACEVIEPVLFEGLPELEGEAISPVEARARIAGGHYDLVVVPPAHGPVLVPKGASWLPWASVQEPLLEALELPEGTLGVVWINAASPLTRRDLGDSVMFATERFDDLTVGVVYGVGPEEGPARSLLFAPSRAGSRPAVGALLDTLPRARLFGLRTALLERIAAANADTDRGALVRGLAQHYAAQEESSPYEKRALQIELSEDALRSFVQALPETGEGESLDEFSRELWESVAWLLIEKRRPDLALAFLEPLATAFTPWPLLDRAVAYAHRELLDPRTALSFLERAEPHASLEVNLYLEFAAVAREIGDDRLAVRYLRKGLELQPRRLDLELPLALALMRLEESEGRALLERLGREHPDHEDIAHYLAEGPPPGGPRPFSPTGGLDHHDHAH